MDVTLVRMKCSGLKLFENGSFAIDLFASDRVSEGDKDDGAVSHLVGSVYKQSSVAFVGMNATGKTATLSILSSLLGVYIGNGSLDSGSAISSFIESEMDVESVFFQAPEGDGYGIVHKVESTIAKGGSGMLSFKEEAIYTRTARKGETKASILSFSDSDLNARRSDVSKGRSFLKDDDSIFSMVMNGFGSSIWRVVDLCSITNHNYLAYAARRNLVVPIAKYLDRSIDDIAIRWLNESKEPVFDIRFSNTGESVTARLGELDRFLSSGTIKGLTCFAAICECISVGGYMLVDEIENHMNKAIVFDMMRMFRKRMNRSGATLIFSTHYSEMLDFISRSDSIYVFDKPTGIRARKFSDAAKGTSLQNERMKKIKRSDIMKSGLVSDSVSYASYECMTDAMESELWGNG